ncbi:DnaJ-domain-containing protein [Byssothecium circinans]|uniref:DnaJ-domain-containing protein n=1 Tax=Byssothecium circinans TaxID=147558 RepID=A0A6A5TZW7_9PLEO|nr:DnaJ-domain-containing protein [Byssothecium circinans]
MPNHYGALRIERNATASEIKTAYRQRALECHPDKTHGLPDTERKAAEELCKAVNNAYEVLSDPDSRQHYDRSLQPAWTAPWEHRQPSSAPARSKPPQRREKATSERAQAEKQRREEAERKKREKAQQEDETASSYAQHPEVILPLPAEEYRFPGSDTVSIPPLSGIPCTIKHLHKGFFFNIHVPSGVWFIPHSFTARTSTSPCGNRASGKFVHFSFAVRRVFVRGTRFADPDASLFRLEILGLPGQRDQVYFTVEGTEYVCEVKGTISVNVIGEDVYLPCQWATTFDIG